MNACAWGTFCNLVIQYGLKNFLTNIKHITAPTLAPIPAVHVPNTNPYRYPHCYNEKTQLGFIYINHKLIFFNN